MKFVEISNTEERVIKFGLSKPDRYKDDIYFCEDERRNPWWRVHVVIKKPGVSFESSYESLMHYELVDLAETIEKSRTFSIGEKIETDFLEPDYDFIIGDLYGTFIVNIRYADSLNIHLTRKNMDDIAAYIRETLEID